MCRGFAPPGLRVNLNSTWHYNIVRVAFLDTLGDRLGVVVLHLKIPSRKIALCYPASLVLGFA